jgi:hypothetical protein
MRTVFVRAIVESHYYVLKCNGHVSSVVAKWDRKGIGWSKRLPLFIGVAFSNLLVYLWDIFIIYSLKTCLPSSSDWNDLNLDILSDKSVSIYFISYHIFVYWRRIRWPHTATDFLGWQGRIWRHCSLIRVSTECSFTSSSSFSSGRLVVLILCRASTLPMWE